jgi:6-phospho-beta-glucosidase
VIGQETHGPGGFFMALRSVHALQPMLDDMAVACPGARVFNYTNPVNIVAQAVADHTDVPIVSLCEGPIVFPQMLGVAAGLDPTKLDVESVGLNHASWSVRHDYDGEDVMPRLEARWQEVKDDPAFPVPAKRFLHLAVSMRSIPSAYFLNYYFEQEVLAELRAKPTTRAEDILAHVDDYWTHYREQAESDDPELDPSRSRGGIHELELAIDCMDAWFNDRDEVLPVNMPNHGSIPGLPDGLVVETRARVDAGGIHLEQMPPVPAAVRGLVSALGEFQQLAGDVAWDGTADDGVRALAAHPLVRSLDTAERLYADMAFAHRAHLPERLLAR